MLKLKVKSDFSGLRKLAKAGPEAFQKAMEKAALQFLNWANNGSANSAKKPPIRWGVLRGSSSAFVGDKHVGNYEQEANGTPIQSYRGKKNTMTWIWNTDYAKKMHEWQGGWGPYTTQDGDAGNKWLEEHLKADKEDLYKMIQIEIKKDLGL